MVVKIRNKITEKQALQWTGKNLKEVYEFCGAHNVGPIERRMDYDLKIKTLESGGGFHIVDKMDWIIKGLRGEFYPCKPDIFERSYDLI